MKRSYSHNTYNQHCYTHNMQQVMKQNPRLTQAIADFLIENDLIDFKIVNGIESPVLTKTGTITLKLLRSIK